MALIATLLGGCGKPASAPGKTGSVVVRTPVVEAPKAVEPAPGKGEKLCFGCDGRGTVPCRVTGCVNGKVDCPGPCLKLSRGNWVHMNIAGHDPSDLWQKFPNGKGGYQAWNQNHVGEVISVQNGQAVNTGPCKICSGAAKVACSICKGKKIQSCEICAGQKFVPLAWTATDNPWFNKQPDIIRLRDGRVLLGKIAASTGDEAIVRLRDGKVIHLQRGDIL